MAEHIPKEFLELLLQRTDLVSLIDGRVPIRKKTGSNFFACCPFHDEKTASFSVSQTKQFYYCFGCGAHGNAIDFMIHYDRLSFPEAVEALAKQQGLTVPHSKSQEKTQSLQQLYTVLEKVAAFYHAQLNQTREAQDYFKQRGISADIIKTFCLGYSPRGNALIELFGKTAQGLKELQDTGVIHQKEGKAYDRFRERLMFPIQDRRGRFIGFGGRVIAQGEPKYLNSPETVLFQKGHELYGLYQVLKTHRQLPRLLIVEGYMDMIGLYQHGITYAAATLGTATTSYHIQSLFRYTAEIVFCFDGDNAGRRAAWRALQVIFPIMPDKVQFRFMFLPEGEDPDSMVRKEGKSAFEKRIQEAQTLSQYFFQALAVDIDSTTADGKTRYINAALEHLKNLPEGIFKQALLTELGEKTRTDVKALQPGSSPTAPATPRFKTASKRSSVLRHALALLVQYPELAQHVSEPLPFNDTPGIDLFNKIVTLATENKQLTTATLRECWRGQPEEKWLLPLAQQELTIPQSGLKAEFLGAIQQVRKQAKEQTVQKLLEKKRLLGALAPEEENELNSLIFNRNTPEEVPLSS